MICTFLNILYKVINNLRYIQCNMVIHSWVCGRYSPGSFWYKSSSNLQYSVRYLLAYKINIQQDPLQNILWFAIFSTFYTKVWSTISEILPTFGETLLVTFWKLTVFCKHSPMGSLIWQKSSESPPLQNGRFGIKANHELRKLGKVSACNLNPPLTFSSSIPLPSSHICLFIPA